MQWARRNNGNEGAPGERWGNRTGGCPLSMIQTHLKVWQPQEGEGEEVGGGQRVWRNGNYILSGCCGGTKVPGGKVEVPVGGEGGPIGWETS